MRASPFATALRIAALCEIDLSPGGVISPRSRPGLETDTALTGLEPEKLILLLRAVPDPPEAFSDGVADEHAKHHIA